METTEGLRNQIRRAGDLQSVVKTMKGLAAVSIRQYERAVESLTDYSRAVELGFQALMRARPDALPQVRPNDEEVTVAIVFGSDQGMCGPLNREIAAHALRYLDEHGSGPERRSVACVGARVRSELEAAGQPVFESFTPPNSAAQLAERVEDILLSIERWGDEHVIGPIMLFHAQPTSGAAWKPRTAHLLPLDMDWLRALAEKPWPSRRLPLFAADWDELFVSLVRQHLFVSLFRAFAESLASENATRLAAMQVAEKNIEERIERLHMRFHQLRQAVITEELLDVVAGFEVLK